MTRLTMMAPIALAAMLASNTMAAPTKGTVTEVSSFELEKSPSGMFYEEATDILYVLCGTATNADHFLYAYSTDGDKLCEITISEDAAMSRVDGFQIVGDVAYIVDSQGPFQDTSLGGSVYEIEWTNPCGCANGACTETSLTITPTVTRQYLINGVSIGDGAGIDLFFRNSGIVVLGTDVFAVNGVHPVNNGDLTSYYPKSLIKFSLDDTSDEVAATEQWAFDAETLGHDVDMEGLTCGADGCDEFLFIGDEYNLIYRLTLSESDPATAVEFEWDISSIVSENQPDKGIESLTFASSTGFFYAGIQETSEVHVLSLSTVEDTSTGNDSSLTAPVSVLLTVFTLAQLFF